ncbi:MAG: glycosyltransferase family 4 protein [Anaerolineae bacterium]|nr:glycosyltransferase family 4 protein [Anaerolineae bacterium]
MHIALDLSPVVHRKAGLATYAQNIAVQVQQAAQTLPNMRLSAFHYDRDVKAPLQPPLAQLPCQTVAWPARRWRLTVALRYFVGGAMDDAVFGPPSSAAGPRVFHATEHLLPPLAQAKRVFTFHDAIFALFPQYHLPMNLLYLNTMMPRFLRRADAIIAVSECSKRDCVRLYGVDPAKIRVIYEGVNPRYRPIHDPKRHAHVREKYHLPPKFLLYLATIEPRKNLVALVEAYHALLNTEHADDVHLVIAGKKGWLFQPVFDRVRELGLESRVHFTDWVDDDDAPVMMSMAEAFVFPSLYEGFGLPPIEAMACGTPVVCANTSSLPEVVGSAGLLFDPADVRWLAQALVRVLFDAPMRAELRARGLMQAAKFSWQNAARETLQVYHDVVAK